MRKWRIFQKKGQDTSAKAEVKKPVTVPDDTVPGLKEGYLVDRFYSYGEPVDFVNEKKGIQKPIIRNHSFVKFPGVEEDSWIEDVERLPIRSRFYYRVEFSRPDEQGHTKVFWMLQPYDTPDSDGFGMENIPEIMLYSTLDENGNYLHPFRLYHRHY